MFTHWGDFYVRRDPSECRIKVTGNSCVALCAGQFWQYFLTFQSVKSPEPLSPAVWIDVASTLKDAGMKFPVDNHVV
jgi:hypothetical protein